MAKPMIRIHDLENDEIIDREMTDAEFAEFKANEAKELSEVESIAIKAAEKVALLERLGITADEAKLLLS